MTIYPCYFCGRIQNYRFSDKMTPKVMLTNLGHFCWLLDFFMFAWNSIMETPGHEMVKCKTKIWIHHKNGNNTFFQWKLKVKPL